MKKTSKILFTLICILAILSPTCFCTSVDFKAQIKAEDGSLFEKIIAECIGGIAQTIFNFTTSDTANVGFKDYDTLIFNKDISNNSLSPFTEDLWNKTMLYYKVFAAISGSLILIAVFILSYKVITAGMNTSRKNDAKESLMRLLFGGIFIFIAPLFIRFLLFLNNSLVNLLVSSVSGSIDGLLGDSMLLSIKTGNAITTALVISMFIYLFVKLNIKFIVRQFTIIIFTIFTPVACSLWIINKNVTATSIWAGQIIMNVFMQFIYCFLFLAYLAFLPSGIGWAVSLIWAMMILPLADALQNCLQNLTSRIAGLDNEQMSGRAMGIETMLGSSMVAIKEQFNTPNTQKQNGTKSSSSFSGFVDKAKSFINPTFNLSDEKDYNGNTNPIRDVIQTKNNNVTTTKSNTSLGKEYISENIVKTETGKTNKANVVSNIAKTAYKGTKAYLNIGARMAEGDFNKNNYKSYNSYSKNNIQDTEYTNNLSNNKNTLKNLGGDNDFKENN